MQKSKTKRRTAPVELEKFLCCLPGAENVTSAMKAHNKFFMKGSDELRREQRANTKNVLVWQ
jgi:hypothetical protein